MSVGFESRQRPEGGSPEWERQNGKSAALLALEFLICNLWLNILHLSDVM
jgi:hypothetical protein